MLGHKYERIREEVRLSVELDQALVVPQLLTLHKMVFVFTFVSLMMLFLLENIIWYFNHLLNADKLSGIKYVRLFQVFEQALHEK